MMADVVVWLLVGLPVWCLLGLGVYALCKMAARPSGVQPTEPLVQLTGPPVYARRCQECGDPFTTTLPPSGSKWTGRCWSCLRNER